ncbi:MAG: T9SS type A sorting domain-containing protein [Bacteroidetes bacterium]|nr:T9SS type A sorting domain-containing protein [Bacteroidota bacterium]
MCSLGHFINCNFRNNNGSAVHTNQDVYANVDDMWFEGCTMFSSREIGMFCTGKNYKFEQCSIYAAVNWSYVGAVEAEATQFIGCTFEDKIYVNPYTGNSLVPWAHSKPLISIPGAGNVPHPMRWTNFKNCTFKVNDKDREFFWLNWTTSGMPKSTWTVIDDCTFTYNNEGQPGLNASFMRGVRFMGENKVENILNGINSYHMMSMQDATVEGSDNACEPNELTFEGQVEHYLPSSNFGPNFYQTFTVGKKLNNTDGYALYHLNNKALLVTEGNTTMEIGAASSFHVHEGASVYGIQHSGTFVTYGGMVAHKNSHISLEDAVFTHNGNAGANNLLYLDKEANKNNVTLSPLWANGIGYGSGTYFPINTPGWFNGYPNSPNKPCLHGGRLNGNFVCTPHLYTNVLSSGSMNLLYHKHVSCFGNVNNNAFKFEIFGGTPGYTFTLNGNISVYANTPYTLSWGTHTLVVTDANNCQQTFTLVIDTTLEYNIIKGCVAGATPAQFSINACTQPTVTGPGNISFAGNVCSVTAAGTYTITATSPTSTVTKTIYIGDCSNCGTVPPEAEWYAPNSSSSAISPNGMLVNKPVVLQGNIQVDNEWFVYNNPQVYMAMNSGMEIQSNKIIIVNDSKLLGCIDDWKGIKADGSDKRIIVNNGSTIRDMNVGIQLIHNAFIQARNSSFIDNESRSILFSEMNDPTYEGIVEGNTFDGMQNECAHGIEIFNCNYINIGNEGDVNSGNTFKELKNGIDIRGDANISAALLGANTNQISIYNNKFEDIQSNPPNMSLVDINNSVYTSPIGAGVNIDYTAAPITFEANTTVRYTGSLPLVNILFNRCSKGIVSQNNNLIAEKLYMKDTWFGIMNRNMMNRTCYFALNKIENTAIGTQLLGNYENYDVIENEIILNEGIGAPYNGNPQQVLIYPAIGIDIKQMNPPYNPDQTFNILTNTINIPFWAGKGIGNLGANKSQLISNNNIFFTVPNGTAVPQVPAYDPSLYGIYNSNCKEIKLDNNLVDGQYSLLNYGLTYSKAYYFETSSEMILSCNKGRATKQGFYVWGGNHTDETKITHNKFRFNRNPLYTLDNGAALPGSFGNIGDVTNNIDNGNDWTFNMAGNNTWLQNQQFKVWRNSSCTNLNPFSDKIVTPPIVLTLLQSGSTNPNVCDYLVDNFVPLAIDPCAPDPNFDNAAAPNVVYNGEEIDIENAEAIALQQQSYINFFEVGPWMDNRNLFERLVMDTALRNSSIILTNFYNNYSNSTIHDIAIADITMNALFDFKGSTIDMISLYNAALAENDNITSNNDHELYEQTINNFALRLTRYGKDSISPLQKTELEFIANLCPFVGGTAVYKARVLWAMYNPIMQYNDRLNCIQNIGQNKNGNSDYINLDSLYEVQVDEQASILANQIKANEEEKSQFRPEINIGDQNTISIYPNPASTQVVICYNSESDGSFRLFNTVGDIIICTTLSKENSKTIILLNDIANGIYHYEIEFANKKKSIGKLSILK